VSGAPDAAEIDDMRRAGDANTPDPAAAHPNRASRSRREAAAFRLAGVTAITVKELRGRMRGRRAFVVLTLYLVALATYAWMNVLLSEARFAPSGRQASALIGQSVFIALLTLETILVVVLAPSFSAGSISQEREKQTLDLLAATPISSLSIVVGKLASALTYVVMLILASIPLTAIVFVYGGAGPEDVIRGYVVLLATAIGLGSLGLFFSALVRRTQAALIITLVTMLVLTQGSTFVGEFWADVGSRQAVEFRPGEEGGTFTVASRPPEALYYLNPFVAQADVACGTETGFGGNCDVISRITGGYSGIAVDSPTSVVGTGREAVPVPAPAELFGVPHDRFWPKSVAAWLILSVILIAASVQLVTPTRRWQPARLRLRPPLRRTP